ncbi:MAG: D-glycero-beta-D-manno-heptose 1-phosphate adenylyltransferase [Candidatus Niyogibacteria bacterium CG10_big_fil_rev_8_21_14_0_10_46_36]|uniref:D-glycero-beta-D-manno-heptose 1-phosphate adenylyltransferase n=1 Tax=Candidatus Niyogibacteria bacterium CG10_big_fil_rev_8_21_14_0_10_46_36 TaxID=1974726 RepID=A0A2H0TFR3_9BACT|nr:MAG: D-glycero-beta-D-manno-heptose 1-phosphate adenylyltransferase [Candidatus Niyogibacteria bacterium CG10_big_fil_rev_8_21_14_0_10_46_36]
MKEKKIVSAPRMKAIALLLRKKKKTLVAVSGAFDILHYGHVRFLQTAKKQGDSLLVFLNSDSSVRAYKGKGRPINKARDRAEMLEALSVVDYIVIFSEKDPRKILSLIRPHIFYQGSDWGKNCIERETVESYGGEIRVFPRIKKISTTALLKHTKHL